MLTLPFLLGVFYLLILGFASIEGIHFVQSQAILPDIIVAANAWLHWYSLYRQPESDEDSRRSSLSHLGEMGKELLSTLQAVFPFKFTVKWTGKSKTATRSMRFNEKVRSIVHGSRNIRHVGRSKNLA
jgi:hypothetical protein